jgi:hypothetical protein
MLIRDFYSQLSDNYKKLNYLLGTKRMFIFNSSLKIHTLSIKTNFYDTFFKKI